VKTPLQPGTRILALDVGERIVGIAATDESGLIASPLPPLIREEGSMSLGKFKKVFGECRPSLVLIGLPRQEGKGLSAPAKKIKNFAKKLGKHFPELKFSFQDEQLSTWSAREKYARLDLRKANKITNIDSFSAMEILEDYLKAGSAD